MLRCVCGRAAGSVLDDSCWLCVVPATWVSANTMLGVDL
jgi:hypothetical protein